MPPAATPMLELVACALKAYVRLLHRAPLVSCSASPASLLTSSIACHHHPIFWQPVLLATYSPTTPPLALLP